MPQFPSKWTPWDLTWFPSISPTVQNTVQNPLLKSPSAAPLYFPESHPWSEIFSFSKVILGLEKGRSLGHQIWAVGGLSDLGDLMFLKKILHETRCRWLCTVVVKLAAVFFSLYCTSQLTKNIKEGLLNCLAWRSVFMMDTFTIKTHS